MPASTLSSMFGLPSGDELDGHVTDLRASLSNIEAYLHVIAQGPDRTINEFRIHAAVQQAVAGPLNLFMFDVPLGKRLAIRRVLTQCPAATGPLALYANQSQIADGGSLIHVVAAPQLAATDIIGTTVIKGGLNVFAVFATAPVGTLNVVLEGQIYDDGPRTSDTF